MTKIVIDTEAKTITLQDGVPHDLNDFTVTLDTPAVEEDDEGPMSVGYVRRKRGPISFFTIRGSWLNKD